MATKTITIKEKAYNLAKASKLPNESFSDLFERTYGKKKPDYFAIVGIWSEKKAEAVRAAIKKARIEGEKLSKKREKRLGLA